jgi:hypothetical protein
VIVGGILLFALSNYIFFLPHVVETTRDDVDNYNDENEPTFSDCFLLYKV